MKLLAVLTLTIVANVTAAPQAARPNAQEVQLIRFDSDNDGLGSYNFAFEQTDQTRREEQGKLKNAGTEQEAISVTGFYSWVGPDGVIYKVSFVADENGFQPTLEKGLTVVSVKQESAAVVATLLG